MFVQLNPPVPLDTDKGAGMALGIIDYGTEHNLIWVVALDENGEIWCLKNPSVRAQKNITFGRRTKKIPKEWWHSRAIASGLAAGLTQNKGYWKP